MKHLAPRSARFILVISMTSLIIPTAPLIANDATSVLSQAAAQSGDKPVRVKRGIGVTARLKYLKTHDVNVRAALKALDRKANKPKLEEAVTVSNRANQTSTFHVIENGNSIGVLQKASLKKTQETVYGSEGEVTFIPSLSTNDEWHGTVIITAYDNYGNFLKQYTANVVFVRDYAAQDWATEYEVGFAGGVGYLNHEPGMWTAFELGTPMAAQPTPPTQFADWQVYTSSFDPREGRYEGDPNGPGQRNPALEEGLVSKHGGVKLTRVSYAVPQAGDRGGDYRYRDGRCPCDPPPAVRRAVGRWAGCTAAACSGAAASCWIAGPFTPLCFGSRCAGAGVACAIGGILLY